MQESFANGDESDSTDSLDELIKGRARPSSANRPATSPPSWPERVHEELVHLHEALQAQRNALCQREKVLEAREQQLSRDVVLLHARIRTESNHLLEESTALLDQRATAHLRRLEEAIGILREQCLQLHAAKNRAERQVVGAPTSSALAVTHRAPLQVTYRGPSASMPINSWVPRNEEKDVEARAPPRAHAATSSFPPPHSPLALG